MHGVVQEGEGNSPNPARDPKRRYVLLVLEGLNAVKAPHQLLSDRSVPRGAKGSLERPRGMQQESGSHLLCQDRTVLLYTSCLQRGDAYYV